jgi:predicted Zn-dependent protease
VDERERDRIFQSAQEDFRGQRYLDASKKMRLLVADGSKSPEHVSFYGLTLAQDKRTVREGIELCQRAIRLGGARPRLHLNLARAYVAMGSRLRAIQTLRLGLRNGPDRLLERELQRLSPRRSPVIGGLHRDHLLNRYLGRMRARLGRSG